MKSLAPAAGALALILCAACSADPGAPEFTAQAPVQLHTNDGLHRIVLPLAVLQRSRHPDLADVRVVDAHGTPVPMAWGAPPPARASTRTVALPRFAWPATAAAAGAEAPVKVRVDAQGAVVRIETHARSRPPSGAVAERWLLDLSRSPHRESASPERLTALLVDWQPPAEGATVRATLEASDDLQQWRDAGGATLLDAPGASGERLSVRRIELPASAAGARYLRLRLEPAVPLRQIQAELQRVDAATLLERTELRFEPVAAGDGQVREWTLDLQGPVPLRQLQLKLPQRNSVASFVLDRRADTREPWQTIARFTSYWLVRDGSELHSSPLELSVAPARHWRLRLAAGSPGIGAGALPAEAQWQPPQLVFAAQGDAPFSLRVGTALAQPQGVSLAQLIPGYRAAEEYRLPAASLGALEAITPPTLSLTERLTRSTPAERRRWTLWAVLALAVGLLAWLARRLLREMNAPPG